MPGALCSCSEAPSSLLALALSLREGVGAQSLILGEEDAFLSRVAGELDRLWLCDGRGSALCVCSEGLSF